MSTHYNGRRRVLSAAACFVAALLGTCACSDDPGASATGIARVSRGTVDATFAAGGVLHEITSQPLGFAQGGKITAINVSVGDRVSPGQLLARIDATPEQAAVRRGQAEVVKQQAVLDQIRAENKAGLGGIEARRFQDLLDSTRRTARASHHADTELIRQLQRQLQADRDNLARQERERRVDHRRCPDYPNAPQSGTALSLTTGASQSSSGTPGDEGPCEFLEVRWDSIAGLRRQIVVDLTSIEVARKRRDANDAQQQASIDNAQASLAIARNKATLAGVDDHFTTIQQQQTLDQAKLDLERVQQALSGTVMKALFSGTVSRIDGQVGTVVPAAYHTSTAAGGGPNSGHMLDQPGDHPLIVLDNVHSFAMTVSIPKAQAEQIAPDQSVDVTMDSIPGLSRRATVTKITPGTLSGGAPGCVVDLVLTELDPRMHDGMDAQVHVVTGSVDNVLTVPTSAVHGIGQNGTVVVIGPGGQRRSVPVAIGVVGVDRVQVLSGLKEGDQVLTSS